MNEANLQTTAAAPQAPYSQGGLTFSRRFSKEGVSPYDDVQWERRTALISDSKGNTIFEQKDVEVPVDWSMTATNIVASKYLHGPIGLAGARDGRAPAGVTRGGNGARLGYCRRLLCYRQRCRHLPR